MYTLLKEQVNCDLVEAPRVVLYLDTTAVLWSCESKHNALARENLMCIGLFVSTTNILYTIYIHTGQTPQRRQFSYPVQLTQTRPHFELLEEFRSTLRSSASLLPEVPESEEDSMTVSCWM